MAQTLKQACSEFPAISPFSNTLAIPVASVYIVRYYVWETMTLDAVRSTYLSRQTRVSGDGRGWSGNNNSSTPDLTSLSHQVTYHNGLGWAGLGESRLGKEMSLQDTTPISLSDDASLLPSAGLVSYIALVGRNREKRDSSSTRRSRSCTSFDVIYRCHLPNFFSCCN